MARIISIIITSIVSIFTFVFSQNDSNKYFSPLIINKLENPTENLNVLWSNFLVTVENYDLWGEINYSNYDPITEPFIDEWNDINTVIIDSTTFYYVIKTDTVFFQEEVFTSNIEDRLLKITPINNNPNCTFKVSVGVSEIIKQFLSLEEYGKDDMYEKEAELETWEKISPYVPIKDSAQLYYRIPKRDSISSIKQLKVDLALRDTSLYYEAEGGGHDINYIFKGKPAEYRITGMVIRIEKYERDVLIETKYIRIVFPEAC